MTIESDDDFIVLVLVPALMRWIDVREVQRTDLWRVVVYLEDGSRWSVKVD